jgi:hypothetical protein
MEFLFSGYGADHPRYGSTLATKGMGPLVRKGTGGRSSVRSFSLSLSNVFGFSENVFLRFVANEFFLFVWLNQN